MGSISGRSFGNYSINEPSLNVKTATGEIKAYLDKQGTPSIPYQDEIAEIEWLKIPGKNTLIQFNEIKPGAGQHNIDFTLYFEKKGLSLVHIWEDSWATKRAVVESKLRALAGKSTMIHGRETEVRPITNPTLLDFLQQNHLHVPLKGKHKYGLFFNAQLVSVASFSYPRNIAIDGQKVRSYELLRFCHLNGYIVVGGLTKLLAHFIRAQPVEHLMTYVDIEWGAGEGFEKAGFKRTGQMPPKTFWINKTDLQRFHQIGGQDTEDLTSQYADVYNCGSYKMEKFIGQNR